MVWMPKKKRAARAKIDRTKRYTLEEAIKLVKEVAYANFDESVDIAVRLGVDPRHSDQMVRGAVVLPHGIGKKIRVLVFAKGEKEKEAIEAGADYVGAEEYIEKIKQGWLEFDRVIAIPQMMSQVGKLGKILGPRGLMPNPKMGTVTMDVATAVKEAKAGKIEYKVDKAGIIHAPVGRVSFDEQKLKENILTLMEDIIRRKPPSAKGTYIKSIAISSTMGPGIKIDPQSILSQLS